jgi:hypothetical protein
MNSLWWRKSTHYVIDNFDIHRVKDFYFLSDYRTISIRSGFHFRRYQIFSEIVGLERGPFSLISTIKELLERKSSGSGRESREYGRRDPSRWPRGILCPHKLAITSPKHGGRSVGIVLSRTQATEV